MRIFKNRGDIYIPSTKFKSDLEQKILLAVLAFVVVFTVVFLLILGFKYDFSAKKFFTPDGLKEQQVQNVEVLPEVEGKTNFLYLMNNEQTEEMYFCTMIQVDMDTLSYKACTLNPSTLADGKKLSDIYASGGAGSVVNAVNLLFGIDIDFYIDQSVDDYKKMFDSMGKVSYTILNDIKYKDTSTYGFNIKIKEGEQLLDGDKASKIIRYYVAEEKNYSAVNDIFLVSLSQQINSENYEKREKLFSTFIDTASTNITVKNFAENIDSMKVLSSETTGVNVYSAEAQYEGNSLTSSSVSDIQGYFTK